MPENCRFYGIIIKMFFKPKEHEPAHIHAIYNEYVGIFDIHSFEMIDGDLPQKTQELVKEWLKVPSPSIGNEIKRTHTPFTPYLCFGEHKSRNAYGA